jgi:multidrug efflux pump subunit AcrA (membrane-fusion protein)
VAKLKIIDYTNANAVVVPSNVIQVDGNGDQFVFEATSIKDKTGIAKKVIVKVGKTSENFTEILSGLEPKTIIVSDGVNTVSEGMKLNF